MAALICNNANGGFGHKSKGYYATFLNRGRKAACRSKPAKGIKIKKSPVPETISSSKKRERDDRRNCDGDDNEDYCDRSSKKKRRVSIPDCASLNEYECLETISGGSYGVVYKVREKETGEIMAMKEEMDGLTPSTLTEIDILKTLEPHPNVVGFKNVVTDVCDGVYVVMEYMETDLRRYIALKKEEEGSFAIDEVKDLMKQLLEGVKFLHQNGVIHRDLKPANVLVNKGGDLKICDFGQSVRYEKEAGPYSSGVGTLWYRAPELLRGFREYSMEVDMWAVGCIMAELVLKEVLFRGEDAKDQLHVIYCILGAPYSKVCSSISGANKVLSEAGFDLLKGLLTHDRKKRTTAEAALKHAWFDED